MTPPIRALGSRPMDCGRIWRFSRRRRSRRRRSRRRRRCSRRRCGRGTRRRFLFVLRGIGKHQRSFLATSDDYPGQTDGDPQAHDSHPVGVCRLARTRRSLTGTSSAASRSEGAVPILEKFDEADFRNPVGHRLRLARVQPRRRLWPTISPDFISAPAWVIPLSGATIRLWFTRLF